MHEVEMAPQSNEEIVRRDVQAHERRDGDFGPPLHAPAWRAPRVEATTPTERSHGR